MKVGVVVFPDGTLESIAGMGNASRNVCGIVPKAKIAADAVSVNKYGLVIFNSNSAIVNA